MNDLDRMKELIHTLNEAGKAYYQQNKEVMSNLEYDKMYDELLELEKKTNTVLSNSPTIHVGYELMTVLEKEAHPSPMLSLDKTKEPDQLAAWLNGQEGILSWKLDGLTIVLTYEHGKLLKAVTRGNGEVGEVVTIVEGAFSGLTGEITEVDNEKQKLKVNIDMFGRETSTELDFNQIDKLS